MVAALAIGLPAAAVGYVALPSEAATAPVAGGIYQLAVTKSGMCLDVTGGSKDNGGLLQQWGCASGAVWQQFRVVSAGTGVYNLVNVNSGKCVDVPAASTTSGVQLQQWACGSGTNQQWKFVASGSGTFQIVSVSSGLCVSDKGASTTSGAAVIQETCTANSNKRWAFNQVGTGGSATVAKDGSGKYTTIQAAIDAVPAGNGSRVTITIAPGTYREVVRVPATKPYVTLQGLGTSAYSVPAL